MRALLVQCIPFARTESDSLWQQQRPSTATRKHFQQTQGNTRFIYVRNASPASGIAYSTAIFFGYAHFYQKRGSLFLGSVDELKLMDQMQPTGKEMPTKVFGSMEVDHQAKLTDTIRVQIDIREANE